MKYIVFFLFLTIAITVLSCSKVQRIENYDLQFNALDESDTAKKVIYVTSTKPIDSIDVNQLIYDIWRIEADEYPENLKIYARIFDSLGHFVTNMAKPYLKDPNTDYWTGFKETLGNKIRREQVIDTFNVREFGANDSIPYNIVLSDDYSGSMSGVKQVIFDATELFVSLKEKYDFIAITSFNKKLDIKVPFTKDKEDIIRLYRQSRERNMGLFSAMRDALWDCIDIFDPTSDKVPRVLVIFSDGDDNYSKKKISELIDKANERNIRCFAVAFGYSKDENLKFLAYKTGGKFYRAYSKEELIAIFRDIYMSLRYYYLITYKPPKFWGYHEVLGRVDVPGRNEPLFAKGNYDTGLGPWDELGDRFNRPIQFDFNQAIIKPESNYIIEEIVDAMQSWPNVKLEIQGHTDNIGTQEFNQDLSERRAKAVLDALAAGGVDSRRLRSRGFGFSMPKVSNDTEEGRAANRRTEFVIIAK